MWPLFKFDVVCKCNLIGQTKSCFLFSMPQGVGQGQGAPKSRWIPRLRPRSQREILPIQTRHESPTETHEKRLVRLITALLTNSPAGFSSYSVCIVSWQGWPWWRPIPWGVWLRIWWWRRAELWPAAALGPPWSAPHAASSGNPHSSKVGNEFSEHSVLVLILNVILYCYVPYLLLLPFNRFDICPFGENKKGAKIECMVTMATIGHPLAPSLIAPGGGYNRSLPPLSKITLCHKQTYKNKLFFFYTV